MFRHGAGGGGDEDDEEEGSKRLLLGGWGEGGTHPGALGSRAARGRRLLDTVKKSDFGTNLTRGRKSRTLSVLEREILGLKHPAARRFPLSSRPDYKVSL